VEVRAALVSATVACDGGERELRRNAGLTGEQAVCVIENAPQFSRPDDAPVSYEDVFRDCTR
jgi:hypothetical protein